MSSAVRCLITFTIAHRDDYRPFDGKPYTADSRLVLYDGNTLLSMVTLLYHQRPGYVIAAVANQFEDCLINWVSGLVTVHQLSLEARKLLISASEA